MAISGGSDKSLVATAADNALDGAAAATIAGWMYRSDGTVTVVGGLVGSLSTFARFQMLHIGSTVYCTAESGSEAYNVYSDISDTGWNHYVSVFDGSQSTPADRVQFYLNGMPKTPVATVSPGITLSATATPFAVGEDRASGSARLFGGVYAEMAVWNAILTPGEITALADALSPLGVRSQTLIDYWPLWGRDGSPHQERNLLSAARTLDESSANVTTVDHPRVFYYPSAPNEGFGLQTFTKFLLVRP